MALLEPYLFGFCYSFLFAGICVVGFLIFLCFRFCFFLLFLPRFSFKKHSICVRVACLGNVSITTNIQNATLTACGVYMCICIGKKQLKMSYFVHSPNQMKKSSSVFVVFVRLQQKSKIYYTRVTMRSTFSIFLSFFGFGGVPFLEYNLCSTPLHACYFIPSII